MDDRNRENKRPDGLSDDLFEKICWMQLAVIRKERQLTQAQVSKKVDLKQSTLSHIEHGRMVPSKENKARLAAFFMGNDWVKNGYSSSDTAVFEKLLADKIDWSKHNHLVARDIGMHEDLQSVLRNRGSLKSKPTKEEWETALYKAKGINADIRAARRQAYTEVAKPARIPKYKDDVEIFGNDHVHTGVLMDYENADTIIAPRILENRTGSYSLEIVNSDMVPRYDVGDVVHVDSTLNAIVGDDVVVVLEYADRRVGFVRKVRALHVDEGGNYASYDLYALARQYEALRAAAQAEADALARGGDLTEEEAEDEFDKNVKENTLTIGIDSEYNCKFISGQHGVFEKIPGHKQNAERLKDTTVIKADIHVIVGCDRKSIPINNRNLKHHLSAWGEGTFGSGPFGGKKW